MKLSKIETEALLDRLELGDCISQALTDYCEGETPAVSESLEEVWARCDQLATLIRSSRSIPVELTELDRSILSECVEGSTWHCHVDADQRAKQVRVLSRLALNLISAGVADQIYVPEY